MKTPKRLLRSASIAVVIGLASLPPADGSVLSFSDRSSPTEVRLDQHGLNLPRKCDALVRLTHTVISCPPSDLSNGSAQVYVHSDAITEGIVHALMQDPASARQQALGWGLAVLEAESESLALTDKYDVNWAASLTPGRSGSGGGGSQKPEGAATVILPSAFPRGVKPVTALSVVLAAFIVLRLALRPPAWAKHRYRQVCRWIDAQALGVRQIVEVEEIDLGSTLTPAAVRLRGWSPQLMTALLGRPDYAVVDPLGRNDPLILLSRKRVERIEQDETLHHARMAVAMQSNAVNERIQKWIALHGGLTHRLTPSEWNA